KMEILNEIIKTSIMLFIVIDAIGGIPIFISLVPDMSEDEVKKVVNLAIIVSFFILLFFGVIGRWILYLFNINLEEFKIAGGFLLLIIALDEIFNILPERKYPKEELGIVPIGCPLLAGPGAITVILVILYRFNFPQNYIIMSVSVVIVTLVNWIILSRLINIKRIFGRKGILLLTKLMGIILAGISINFLASGIKNLFTG
ncbi:MAG TPA: MarC family protein, partial [Candidatus Ratteibacteria bacterium]|nr:MarC family protein [Candidatus Ratteibacteria bacterium]